VFNVLYHYGFLEGEITTAPQTRASSFEQYGSPAGGLVGFEVELGERVDRGDTLFEITDPFGTVNERVTANSGGVFWRHRRLPQVATGEYVCSLGTNIDEY